MTITVHTKSPRSWLPTLARVVAGLAWLVFGLDGFFEFFPRPTTPPPAGAMAFGGALFQTGYMIPLIKGTETLVGALLLANIAVPLALVLIAPVLVNIFLFHIMLTGGSDLLIPIVLLALVLYLAWTARRAYRRLFTRLA